MFRKGNLVKINQPLSPYNGQLATVATKHVPRRIVTLSGAVSSNNFQLSVRLQKSADRDLMRFWAHELQFVAKESRHG